MASGGDNLTLFTQATDRGIDPVDLDALATFIEDLPQPFSAGIEGRISVTPVTHSAAPWNALRGAAVFRPTTKENRP